MDKTAPDQYEEIVTDALKSCSAKLRKSFKTTFIQLMILYMVLPRKINFTQMGRYSDSSEQRFQQLFECEFDWMQFNLFLMLTYAYAEAVWGKCQESHCHRRKLHFKVGKEDSLYR